MVLRFRRSNCGGMHGQTIYHRGRGARYLGRQIASTLQIGEAAVVAERTGLRVISNFRTCIRGRRSGGSAGSLCRYLLLRDRRIGRVALNIGGFANINGDPSGCETGAGDRLRYGSGNRVIDALVRRMTKGAQTSRRGRRIARAGTVPRIFSTRCLPSRTFTVLLPNRVAMKISARRSLANGFANELPTERLDRDGDRVERRGSIRGTQSTNTAHLAARYRLRWRDS